MATLGNDLDRFYTEVTAIEFPTGAQDEAGALLATAAGLRDAARELAGAATPEQYESAFRLNGFQYKAQDLDRTYAETLLALR